MKGGGGGGGVGAVGKMGGVGLGVATRGAGGESKRLDGDTAAG